MVLLIVHRYRCKFLLYAIHIYRTCSYIMKMILEKNNECNIITGKAEKDQIFGETFIALPSYMARNAYCLMARKQLNDKSVLY